MNFTELLLIYFYSLQLGAVWIKIVSVHLTRGRRTLIWRQKSPPLCPDVSLMSMNLRFLGFLGQVLARMLVNDLMQPSMHAGCFHCMHARSWHRMLSPTPCHSCPDMWWWLIKSSLCLVECLYKVKRLWLTPGKKIPRKEFHACLFKASSGASDLLLTRWPGASALQRFTTEPQARVKKQKKTHIYIYIPWFPWKKSEWSCRVIFLNIQ